MSALELEDYRVFTGRAELHKAINTLMGILQGITLDRHINEAEVMEVRNWIDLYTPVIDRHPFNELIPVLQGILEDRVITSEEVEDLSWLCDRLLHSGDFTAYYDQATSLIQQLEGILHGALSDNVLLNAELYSLQQWMDAHACLSGLYPFDEVYGLLCTVLDDGTITDDERNLLKAFFATFVDLRDSYNLREPEIKSLQALYSVNVICSVSPHVVIPGHSFCFTGVSAIAKRREVEELIVAAGGIYNGNVTKNTEYLIVGAEGNPCWAFSCYGRKVERAMQMRKEGHHIQIINERNFWAVYPSEHIQDQFAAVFKGKAPATNVASCVENIHAVPPAPSTRKHAKLNAEQQMLPEFEVEDEVIEEDKADASLQFLYSIESTLREAAASFGGDERLIKIIPRKSYISVLVSTFTAFRINLSGRNPYISIPRIFSDLIPDGVTTKVMASDQNQKYTRIILDETHPATWFTSFLTRLIQESVNRFPKEWDCCSRYTECSEARHCVHPDRAFALGCGYRKILTSGRIFYGSNRNID